MAYYYLRDGLESKHYRRQHEVAGDSEELSSNVSANYNTAIGLVAEQVEKCFPIWSGVTSQGKP